MLVAASIAVGDHCKERANIAASKDDSVAVVGVAASMASCRCSFPEACVAWPSRMPYSGVALSFLTALLDLPGVGLLIEAIV